jgi:hypothetical protein
MESILDLVRFLSVHNQWLVTLDLNNTVHREIKYKVPDRSTFYKFAGRLGKEKMLEIFVHVVIQLINLGIIKGDKVSLDCSIIWAWFKDCRWVTIPDMIRRNAGVTGAEIEMLHGHGTITGKSTSMDTRFM